MTGTMAPLRVLVISNMYPRRLGGMFVHDQTRHLAAMGCSAVVVAPSAYCPLLGMFIRRVRERAAIPPQDVVDGIPVHYPGYFRLPGALFHGMATYTQHLSIDRCLDAIMEEFDPHLIHAHAATPAGYTGLMLKKRYGLPLVVSLRGSDVHSYPKGRGVTRLLTKRVIRGADRVVSVSCALGDEAGSIASPRHEIRVIHNGVDAGLFAPNIRERARMRGILGIEDDERAVIYVGDMVEEKGVPELLAAFEALRGRYRRLHLILVGNQTGCREMIVRLAAGEAGAVLHVVGAKDRSEVPAFLGAADIFVFPSRAEGLPNAVLEAMAAGLPVVAARVGGIPEAVEEGKSGLLVAERDVGGLMSAIETLICGGERARRMGEYGRSIILRKFTWQKNAEETMRVYADALDVAGRGGTR